ncbi:hypothetical protein Cpir12675_000052 [Ceratocystis pirilliformis]|uniref:C2H2-type domain-containing protein n=1 Tax=Ceratocystis pirilliformis TaxID=259994 RepID=A0ABR3ZPI0_9PEZI
MIETPKNREGATPSPSRHLHKPGSHSKAQDGHKFATVHAYTQDVRRKILDMTIDQDTMMEDELAEKPKKRRVISPPTLASLSPATQKEALHDSPDLSLKFSPSRPLGTTNGNVTTGLSVSNKDKMLPGGFPKTDTEPLLPMVANEAAKNVNSETSCRGKKRGHSHLWRPDVEGDVLYDTDAMAQLEKQRKPRRNIAVRSYGGTIRARSNRGSSSGRPRAQRKKAWQTFVDLRPEYSEFVCEWQGCPAKLFNMDTMRRHVEIVHMRPIEIAVRFTPLGCFWGDCMLPRPCVEGKQLSGKKFNNMEELREHMEEAHMVPMSWHMGDGPMHDPDRNGLQVLRTGEPLPRYLFDAQGNQVTPDIRGQPVEDKASRKKRSKRLRQFFAQVNANIPSEDEDEDENNYSEEGTDGIARDKILDGTYRPKNE